MKKEIVNHKEKLVIGIKVRTNNAAEADPLKGRIFPCVKRYFHENLAARIPNRKNPGATFCIYTEYENGHRGDYTYFIGEEVSLAGYVPEGFEILKIPQQKYAKFTNGPGSMPDVVRKPWEMIWKMSSKEMGGERAYLADFEIYDERSRDHQNIVLDFYIGIKNG
jgi:predicted transcriptional regulator YdeE